MEYKRTNIKTLIIFASIIVLLIVVWFHGFTVVKIQQMEEIKSSEEFNPKAFVDNIWESKLIPTIQEKAVDLSKLLGEIKPDDSGFISKESLIPVTKNYGLITAGEAHVYAVKGQGKVVEVNTKTSLGKLELLPEGYTGPIKVIFYIGPRIPSDESSIRDVVGFINFGDFREQTEYGKVNLGINQRTLQQINLSINQDPNNLEDKTISFYGAFTIRTFNLTKINVQQINIVPIHIEIL
jgi:predicted lipoprotein